MQMTPDARTWLDDAVRRILARYALGDPERAGVTYELMSHLHAAGETRAQKAGRTEVTRDDLEWALADSGGEAELASAFVAPLAKPLERVLFWRRLWAFAIDVLLVGIAVSFVHSAVTAVFTHFFDDTPTDVPEFAWLFPWGFHDLGLPVEVQALIGVASAITVLGYFAWFDKNEGRSLGKRALGLRVMRIDGSPLTYREAIIRNLVKLTPALLILDTLLMLLFLRKHRQRLSDRMADTIVVKV